MTKSTWRTVTLPGGKNVRISDLSQPWWSVDNASGYIDPRLLAPDPRQPRKHMNTTEFAELKVSVRERGVRQPIVITPRGLVPWVILPPEHDKLPFVIVSGHRRDRSAIEEDIEAVPILVRIYETREDHRLDAFLLNEGHADLTPLEQGQEIVRLNSEDGVSFERIAKGSGRSIKHVLDRRNLTRLDPNIQRLIDPGVSEKRELGLSIASALGGIPEPTPEELEQAHILFDEDIGAVKDAKLKPRTDIWAMKPDRLRFEMQKVLLAGIRHHKFGSVRAVEFIAERAAQLSSADPRRKKGDRFEPGKRREILMNLTRTVMQNKTIGFTPGDFEKMFENVPDKEVELFVAAYAEAGNALLDIGKLIQRCKERRGKPEEATRKVVPLPKRA